MGIECLVSIAVIGAFAIGEFSEVAVVTFLFQFGSWLEQKTMKKTRSSIKALTELAPTVAWRKEAQRAPELCFGFCLTDKTLHIIEDTGEYKALIARLVNHSSGAARPSQLLLRLLELLTENDVPYMMHIETELERMEDELGQKPGDDFFRRLTRHRQKLSELGAYYGQLSDIGERLSDEVCAPLSGDCAAWEKFARRAERLQDHAELVAESALQLRELYQSEQDSRQNRIMGLLTVVTTLFLPLTLLTGWYGMNFRNMPELSWRCGYAVVAVVALVIVVIEIIWLRKNFKKF